MRFSRVGLSAFGIAIPEQILTSREIEAKLAPALTGRDKKFSNEGWFEALTGVAERRLWKKTQRRPTLRCWPPPTYSQAMNRLIDLKLEPCFSAVSVGTSVNLPPQRSHTQNSACRTHV